MIIESGKKGKECTDFCRSGSRTPRCVLEPWKLCPGGEKASTVRREEGKKIRENKSWGKLSDNVAQGGR